MWINFFANGSFVISSNARDPTYFHVTLVHALSFLQRSSRLFSLPTGRVLISSAPSEHSTMLSFSTICLSHIHALNHAHTHTRSLMRTHALTLTLPFSLLLSLFLTHTHTHTNTNNRLVETCRESSWREMFRQVLSKRVGGDKRFVKSYQNASVELAATKRFVELRQNASLGNMTPIDVCFCFVYFF